MTTPLLILLLGVSPPTAVGTALAFGAIVKVASVPVYAARRQVNTANQPPTKGQVSR